MNRHAIYLHEENRRGTGLESKSPECSPDKCLRIIFGIRCSRLTDLLLFLICIYAQASLVAQW